MKIDEFLHFAIEDALCCVSRKLGGEAHSYHLAGATAGLELCRDKSPREIMLLLGSAAAKTKEMRRSMSGDYWRAQSAEQYIIWIAETVSAALLLQDLAPIIEPGEEATSKALEILGEHNLSLRGP